jgi:hypothetical protein
VEGVPGRGPHTAGTEREPVKNSAGILFKIPGTKPDSFTTIKKKVEDLDAITPD